MKFFWKFFSPPARAGINWNDMNVISRTGVNWNDLGLSRIGI